MSKEQEVILCLEGLKIGFKLNPDLKQENVKNICQYIDKAISLIENLQKEILELKSKNNSFYGGYTTEILTGLNEYYHGYISRDKIREKIKELSKVQDKLKKEAAEKNCSIYLFQSNIDKIGEIVYCKQVLKELLGEKDE